MVENDLPALYKHRRVMLWVEDTRTRGYLDAVWGSGRIGYLIGGSHDNIRAVVTDAHRKNYPHVFGLVDRDFGRSNRARWPALGDGERIYVLDRVEIENYLLDAHAISACKWNTEKRTPDQIEACMRAAVRNTAWWWAARRVLYALNAVKNAGFPRDPKPQDVTGLDAARRWLHESSWITETLPGLRARVTDARLTADLEAEHAVITCALDDGSWPTCCAGKEVLAAVDAFVWTRGRLAGAHDELARAIAAEQVSGERVPGEISELEVRLEERVGRASVR